jgi:hypothetical protein
MRPCEESAYWLRKVLLPLKRKGFQSSPSNFLITAIFLPVAMAKKYHVLADVKLLCLHQFFSIIFKN